MTASDRPVTSMTWTFERCPLCRSAIGDELTPPVPDRDGGQVCFRSCPTCWTLFPSGAVDDVGVTDETERQADYHRDLWKDVNLEELDLVASHATQLAWEMAEFLPPPASSGALVDIGAGRGNIIHAVSRLGYPVLGCEPSAFLCQVARAAYLLGPNILVNTDAETFLHQVESSGAEISGYVLWHVLEHVRSPLEILERCRRLAPSATFFIELPVAMDEDIFPEHLFFPTPASLVRLADRLHLVIDHLSVTADNRLRVFYRGRDPRTVDLTTDERQDGERPVELASIEADYRALSPAFAHFRPEPTRSVDDERVETATSGRES